MSTLISDTKVKFLHGWIPDKWCQSESKLYHFDSAAGQLTVKRGGFYWIYGHVRYIVQNVYFIANVGLHSRLQILFDCLCL